MTDHDSHRMTCMEVWGGNQPADSGVRMLGLDAWVYSQPYKDGSGGGDVHYVSSCATGRVTRMLLADVSGHGEVVAKVGAALRRLMRRNVNYIDQRRFVGEMNREFTTLATDGRFATAVVTTFFAPNNHLSISNAGHPSPFLYRVSNGQWSLLRAGSDESGAKRPGKKADLANIPWGITDQVGYEQFGIRFNEGDMAMLYSDSLIEGHGRDGELLGESGLLEIVRKLDMSVPDEFIRSLLDAIRGLHEGNLLDDDVTILLFRSNGTAPPVPFMKRLLAPIRVLVEAVRSLKPGVGPAPWPELSVANLGGPMLESLNRSATKDDK